MSEHIADRAAGLASLPADDPERASAYAHASGCPPCRRALEEAERLIALLDSAPAPAAPSDAVLRRVQNAVLSEMGGERQAPAAAPARANRLVAALAVGVSLLLVLFDAKTFELAWAIGVECLLIELGTAAVAVGVASIVIRNRAGTSPAQMYAALGAWSAVVAQVYLHFRCPVSHEAGHLVLFHLGGVVLATLFAAPFGARLERRAT